MCALLVNRNEALSLFEIEHEIVAENFATDCRSTNWSKPVVDKNIHEFLRLLVLKTSTSFESPEDSLSDFGRTATLRSSIRAYEVTGLTRIGVTKNTCGGLFVRYTEDGTYPRDPIEPVDECQRSQFRKGSAIFAAPPCRGSALSR